jgi:hypothetical protein
MSETKYEKNHVYDNIRAHRLCGQPKRGRDYSVLPDGNVQSTTVPVGGKFTLSKCPNGISCFVPILPPSQHGGFPNVASCSVLLSNVPENWKFVYTHIMKLPSASLVQTEAYHFNLFSTTSITEADFLGVLKTNSESEAAVPRWGMCNMVASAGDIVLLNDSDLDGFDDTRVRNAAYYAAIWYADSRADDVDRCHLYDLYSWLVEEKPTLESVFQDYRHNYLVYYLDNFGADDGDFMGAADLQDIKLSLDSLRISDPQNEYTESIAVSVSPTDVIEEPELKGMSSSYLHTSSFDIMNNFAVFLLSSKYLSDSREVKISSFYGPSTLLRSIMDGLSLG